MRTADDIWREIRALPLTPQGIERRLDLIDQLPTDPEQKQEHNHDHAPTPQASPQNYYYGHTATALARILALREAGIVIHEQRIGGAWVRVLHLAPPMRCRPIPDGYTGKLRDKGRW